MNTQDDSSESGFAPSDPTDDREQGEWATRYCADARARINFEARYLFAHLIAALVAVLAIAMVIESIDAQAAADSAGKKVSSLTSRQVLFAWLGGILGGTLYAIKWLYHVVAKNLWNSDRRLWRLFTPHVSGGLATVFIILSLIHI